MPNCELLAADNASSGGFLTAGKSVSLAAYRGNSLANAITALICQITGGIGQIAGPLR
jgi:hypothetical protein